MAVEVVHVYDVTQGLIEAASETALAPAFVILKGVIGAVQDALQRLEKKFSSSKVLRGHFKMPN